MKFQKKLSNCEICILATKGKPKRISAGVRQLVTSPIREHSQKPDEVKDRILQLVGDLPRIELFAREKTEGWDAIGFDIDGKDIKESIKLLAQNKSL
jgi:N6-adenosine-specific RNA methylase IME4